jgi:hypothetical protein
VYKNTEWSACDPGTLLRTKTVPVDPDIEANENCAKSRILTKDCKMQEDEEDKKKRSANSDGANIITAFLLLSHRYHFALSLNLAKVQFSLSVSLASSNPRK